MFRSRMRVLSRGAGGTVPRWFADAQDAPGRASGPADAARLWFPAVEAWLFRPLPALLRDPSVVAGEAAAGAARVAGARVFGVHVRLRDAVSVGYRKWVGGAGAARSGRGSSRARRVAPLTDYLAHVADIEYGRCVGGGCGGGGSVGGQGVIVVASDDAATRASAGDVVAARPGLGAHRVVVADAPMVPAALGGLTVEVYLKSEQAAAYSLTCGIVRVRLCGLILFDVSDSI